MRTTTTVLTLLPFTVTNCLPPSTFCTKNPKKQILSWPEQNCKNWNLTHNLYVQTTKLKGRGYSTFYLRYSAEISILIEAIHHMFQAYIQRCPYRLKRSAWKELIQLTKSELMKNNREKLLVSSNLSLTRKQWWFTSSFNYYILFLHDQNMQDAVHDNPSLVEFSWEACSQVFLVYTLAAHMHPQQKLLIKHLVITVSA